MRYINYYEKYTGLKVPDLFDIHHIDHDRKNNDVSNLVAIPRALHRSYHRYFKYRNIEIDLLPSIESGMNGLRLGFPEKYLFIMIKNKNDISQWILFREYLTGNIPILNPAFSY